MRRVVRIDKYQLLTNVQTNSDVGTSVLAHVDKFTWQIILEHKRARMFDDCSSMLIIEILLLSHYMFYR